MDIDECLKERLLRKIKPDRNKIISSLRISEKKLEEARELFEKGFLNQAVVLAYTSMFHAARAILYRDGIQEKSHYAVFVYINEKYSDKIPKSLLNSFDNYRNERHEALYGFDYEASKEDTESALLDAEDFLFKIKGIIENGKL